MKCPEVYPGGGHYGYAFAISFVRHSTPTEQKVESRSSECEEGVGNS